MGGTEHSRGLTLQFPEKNLGYITLCADHLGVNATLKTAADIFDRHTELHALAVELENGEFGLLKRESVHETAVTAPESMMIRGLAEYCDPVHTTYDARDNCLAIAADLVQKNDISSIQDLIVLRNGSYLGVVSIQHLLRHVAELQNHELAFARKMQELLINRSRITTSGFEHEFLLKLSHDLGGDFYQCLTLSENLFMIASFDVSGKNFSASLTTSIIGSFFATLSILDESKVFSPATILRSLNNVLIQTTPMDVFAAGLVYFIDTRAGTVAIYNFGYSRITIISPDGDGRPRIAHLDPTCKPLGIEEMSTTEEIESGKLDIHIKQDLRLISYSDGLTDLENPLGEKFGEENAEDFIKKHYLLSARDFIKAIEKKTAEFRGGAPQSDDITVLFLKF